MAKKVQFRRTRICTHCGATDPTLQGDHVFPQCTYIGASRQRPPEVDSCESCNPRAKEALFKHILPLIDYRFYTPEFIEHLHSGSGKADRKDLQDLTAEFGEMTILSLGPSITKVLTKMFMGLRRHLDPRNWFYLPPDRFFISRINVIDGDTVAWKLPQTITGKKRYFFVDEPWYVNMADMLPKQFRQYRFGQVYRDEESRILGIHYNIVEHPHPRNTLLLACTVWDNPKPATQKLLNLV